MRFPADICGQCQANAPEHWLTDFWFYCEHHEVMIRRRSRADIWTIDQNVSQRQARRHLDAAMKKVQKFAKKTGMEVASIDKLLTWYRDVEGRR